MASDEIIKEVYLRNGVLELGLKESLCKISGIRGEALQDGLPHQREY